MQGKTKNNINNSKKDMSVKKVTESKTLLLLQYLGTIKEVNQ